MPIQLLILFCRHGFNCATPVVTQFCSRPCNPNSRCLQGHLQIRAFAPEHFKTDKVLWLYIGGTLVTEQTDHQVLFLSAVPPSLSINCADRSFHVVVKFGSQGFNFQIIVGEQRMTASLAQQYDLQFNATHFHFRVPFSAPEVVFEVSSWSWCCLHHFYTVFNGVLAFQAVKGSFLKTRLYVGLYNLQSNQRIEGTSMNCDHSVTLTGLEMKSQSLFASFLCICIERSNMISDVECFPNGTITAWALKLKAVPSLDPSRLVLNDPSCRPSFSDHRSAYFVFAANTCGTTRKVTRWKVSQLARKLVRRDFNGGSFCLPCSSLSITWCCTKMKFLCLKMKTVVKRYSKRNRNTSESFPTCDLH